MEQANDRRFRLANLVAEVYAANYEVLIRRRRITLAPQRGFEVSRSEMDLLETLRPHEQELVKVLEAYPGPFAQIASIYLSAVSDPAARGGLRDCFEAYVEFYQHEVGWDRHSAQRVAYADLLDEAKRRGLPVHVDYC